MSATMYPSSRADRIVTRRGDDIDDIDVIDYAARRAVAAVVAVLVVAVFAIGVSALVGALVDVGGRPAAASDIAAGTPTAPIVRVHVAQPGDTIWSIADRYRGDVGQGRFVDALVDLNGGAAIQIGQAVRLP